MTILWQVRYSCVGSIQAAQPLYKFITLINSDGSTKLFNPPQACLSQLLRELDPPTEPAVERWQQHVLKDLPGVSPLTHLIRTGSSEHLGICRDRWPAARSAHVAQTGVPPPAAAARICGRFQVENTEPAQHRGLSSKRSEARKGREGRQRETGVRGAAELNGEAYTESLLSI